MDLNQKTLERIVYNSVANDTEFRKLLLGSTYFLPLFHPDRTEVEVKRVKDSKTSDGYIDISFKATFYDLEYRHETFDKHGSLTINKLLYTQYNRELTL